ncbi:DUF3079 domain-containing protein [Xanthomonas sacchari]|uniref:DUF3079 domain-containing protein n=1 Tax=Xanthomonas sacchari TaxID=56458 RepID=UPI0020C305A3|nr:DUF3079 domain-containing protein [Xanthomonas sacchari]
MATLPSHLARAYRWPSFPLAPRRPERLCRDCDGNGAAQDLACGTGTGHTPHPIETPRRGWARRPGHRRRSGAAGACSPRR